MKQDNAAPRRPQLRTAAQLEAYGLIDRTDVREIEEVARRFSIGLTPAMAALIHGEPKADPIAAQFIPTSDELVTSPEELADPIGDEAFSPVVAGDGEVDAIVEVLNGNRSALSRLYENLNRIANSSNADSLGRPYEIGNTSVRHDDVESVAILESLRAVE